MLKEKLSRLGEVRIMLAVETDNLKILELEHELKNLYDDIDVLVRANNF